LVLVLVLPLASLYTAGSAWLLAEVVQGDSPLRLIQFALLAGFVIAAFIFANFTISLRAVTILEGDFELPGAAEVSKQLEAERYDPSRRLEKFYSEHPDVMETIRSRTGQELHPTIAIRSGYVDHVRDLYLRSFLTLGALLAFLMVLSLAVQWPLALAFSSWSEGRIDDWTIRMMAGMPLIPLALIGALTLGFYVLSHLKKLRSLLVTALLLALIPLLITYTLKGSTDEAALLSAVITAAIGALADAIAQLVKEKPGATLTGSASEANG
jgi:hypothetical protein